LEASVERAAGGRGRREEIFQTASRAVRRSRRGQRREPQTTEPREATVGQTPLESEQARRGSPVALEIAIKITDNLSLTLSTATPTKTTIHLAGHGAALSDKIQGAIVCVRIRIIPPSGATPPQKA
jgi:hypothetical protein